MSTQSVKRHCGGTRLSSLRTNPGGFKREGGGVEGGVRTASREGRCRCGHSLGLQVGHHDENRARTEEREEARIIFEDKGRVASNGG